MFTYLMAHSFGATNTQYQGRAGELENRTFRIWYWADYRSGELDGRLLEDGALFQRESPITHPLTLLNILMARLFSRRRNRC